MTLRTETAIASLKSFLWTREVTSVDRLFVTALLALRLFLHRGSLPARHNQGSSWSQILSQVLPPNLVEHHGRLMFVVTQTSSVVSGMHYVVSLSRAHLLAISRPPHQTNTQLIEIIIFLLQLLVHDKFPDLHATHALSPVQSCLPPITPS
jgi:hypothetical protein